MTRRYVALALVAVTALAGCSPGDAGSSAGSAKASPSTPTASPSTPTPTPTATPTPSATPLPTTRQHPGTPLKARNGTRLGTCHDAKCEVIVRPGDVIRFDRKLGTSRMQVLRVSHGQLTTTLGGAVLSFGAGASGGTGKFEFLATAVRGHRAVLYFHRT